MFMKIVKKLQEEGLLNARRKIRYQYAGDNFVIETSVAGQLGVKARDVLSEREEYPNAEVSEPMSKYLSKSPSSFVSFPAKLFRVYLPIGRSGTVETILESNYLEIDDKVTEKNKRKIEKIQNALREEAEKRSHSRE
jgi:hypothetical protein